MGKDRLVDKTLRPMTVGLTTLTPGSVIQNLPTSGVLPIGNYKGAAAFIDLDKLANQPLIWAEKQWTEDVLDSRNAIAAVAIPIGTAVGAVVTGVAPGGVITVPAGEVWYVMSWGMVIPVNAGYAAGDLVLNFLVSSFPPLAVGVPKPYIAPEHLAAATVFGVIAAGGFVPGAQFPAGDELGVPLRLVGGDTVTPTFTVETAITAGAIANINFVLYGRKAKVLVA